MDHEHDWDEMAGVCKRCGLTHQEVCQKGYMPSCTDPMLEADPELRYLTDNLPMNFINVTRTTKGGNEGSKTINVGLIRSVSEHNGQAIISVIGENWDVWTKEDKPTIDRMILEAGGKVVSAY